jgi:hypothetical protein
MKQAKLYLPLRGCIYIAGFQTAQVEGLSPMAYLASMRKMLLSDRGQKVE